MKKKEKEKDKNIDREEELFKEIEKFIDDYVYQEKNREKEDTDYIFKNADKDELTNLYNPISTIPSNPVTPLSSPSSPVTTLSSPSNPVTPLSSFSPSGNILSSPNFAQSNMNLVPGQVDQNIIPQSYPQSFDTIGTGYNSIYGTPSQVGSVVNTGYTGGLSPDVSLNYTNTGQTTGIYQPVYDYQQASTNITQPMPNTTIGNITPTLSTYTQQTYMYPQSTPSNTNTQNVQLNSLENINNQNIIEEKFKYILNKCFNFYRDKIILEQPTYSLGSDSPYGVQVSSPVINPLSLYPSSPSVITPSDIGIMFLFEKMYRQIVTAKKILDYLTDEKYEKIKKLLEESIEHIKNIIFNYEIFKDKIVDIIDAFQKFIKSVIEKIEYYLEQES